MQILNSEEENIFRKEVKKKLIDLGLTYEDLSTKTGYSLSGINSALASNGKISKFQVSAFCEALDLNINEIRRVANGR